MEINKPDDITPELAEQIRGLPDLLRLTILVKALCVLEVQKLEKKKRSLLTMKWMLSEKNQ